MKHFDLAAVGGRATDEERRSATGISCTIPRDRKRVWSRALRALTKADVPHVVTGAFAVFQHTGIWRETRDMDVLLERCHLDDAFRALRASGFECKVVDAVWLAKAYCGKLWVDLLFGSGNGLITVDSLWYTRSDSAVVCGIPTRIAPPEELLWMKAFVVERHRFDGPDIVQIINETGHLMDWEHLCRRFGEHWRLLAIHVILFDYVFPGRRDQIPQWVRRSLIQLMRRDADSADVPDDVCLGGLVSRFSYLAYLGQKGYDGPTPGNATEWYAAQELDKKAHPPAA